MQIRVHGASAVNVGFYCLAFCYSLLCLCPGCYLVFSFLLCMAPCPCGIR